MTINIPNEDATTSIVLECAVCRKLLGTAAPVPAHDLVLCWVCAGLAPGRMIECPTTGLAGFRLFRKANIVLTLLKDLGLRAGKAPLGFIAGCLLGLAFLGAFAAGATLVPASHTVAAIPILCR